MGVSAFVYCTCTEILPSRSLLLRLMRFRGIVSRRKTCLAESHTDELASRLSLCKLQLQRRGGCSSFVSLVAWHRCWCCAATFCNERFCVLLLMGLLFSSALLSRLWKCILGPFSINIQKRAKKKDFLRKKRK